MQRRICFGWLLFAMVLVCGSLGNALEARTPSSHNAPVRDVLGVWQSHFATWATADD